jgi:hypothetical protein
MGSFLLWADCHYRRGVIEGDLLRNRSPNEDD